MVDGQPMGKAQITYHGNEGSIRREIRSNPSMGFLAGYCIMIFTGTLNRWPVTEIDVKSAYLELPMLLKMLT